MDTKYAYYSTSKGYRVVGGTAAHFLKADGSLDNSSYLTTDTLQNVAGRKTFFTSGGAGYNNHSLRVYSNDGSNPGMTFYKEGVDIANIYFDGNGNFKFRNSDDTVSRYVFAQGFKKDGSSGSRILLGDGTDRPVTDFTTVTSADAKYIPYFGATANINLNAKPIANAGTIDATAFRNNSSTLNVKSLVIQNQTTVTSVGIKLTNAGTSNMMGSFTVTIFGYVGNSISFRVSMYKYMYNWYVPKIVWLHGASTWVTDIEFYKEDDSNLHLKVNLLSTFGSYNKTVITDVLATANDPLHNPDTYTISVNPDNSIHTLQQTIPNTQFTRDYISSGTDQTGLIGDKTTSGNWTFNGTGANGITLLRPGNTINNSIAMGFDTVSMYLGMANSNTFAIGNNANMVLSNRKFWVDFSTNTVFAPGQIGGTFLQARDTGGYSIATTTTGTSRAEMIVRHNWSGNNKTFTLGGVSASANGSMSQWGMFRYLNDRTTNGSDGFFGWIGDNDVLRATSLGGTGTRMVVADSTGTLSTQTIPDVSAYLPLSGGTLTGALVIRPTNGGSTLEQDVITFQDSGTADGNIIPLAFKYGTSTNPTAFIKAVGKGASGLNGANFQFYDNTTKHTEISSSGIITLNHGDSSQWNTVYQSSIVNPFFSRASIISRSIGSVATTLDAELPNGGLISSYSGSSWGGSDRPTGASYGGYIKFKGANSNGFTADLDFYYNNGHGGSDLHRLWFRTKNFTVGSTNWFELATREWTTSQLGNYVTQSGLNTQLANYATLNGVQTFTNTNTFSKSPVIPNGTLDAHAVNVNQLNTKANAQENATAVGFSSGNIPTTDGNSYPYMYHSSGLYVALATQSYVQTNFLSTPNGTSVIISGSNLNDYLKTGFYRGSGLTNAPLNNGGWWYVVIETHDSTWVTQKATSFGSGNIPNVTYQRTMNGGSWSDWAQVWTTQDFTTTNIQQWNYAYQYGLKVNETFSVNMSSGMAITDGILDNESGLTDLNEKNLVSAKRSDYYKYGSSIQGFEGLNYEYKKQKFGLGREINDTDKLTVEGSVKASKNFKSEGEKPDTLFIPNGELAILRDEIVNDQSDYAIRLDPHEYEVDPSGSLEVDDRNRLIHIIGEQIKMVVNFRKIYPKQQIVIYNFDQNGGTMVVKIQGKTIANINARGFLRLYVTKSLRVIAERQQPCDFVWG